MGSSELSLGYSQAECPAEIQVTWGSSKKRSREVNEYQIEYSSYQGFVSTGMP